MNANMKTPVVIVVGTIVITLHYYLHMLICHKTAGNTNVLGGNDRT